ncbi:MAG: hypothetical protein GC189_02070 [Alphaproteobacteria bacterium]|nr:hypothetical protein [Alphaproteobacteria bacterium]
MLSRGKHMKRATIIGGLLILALVWAMVLTGLLQGDGVSMGRSTRFGSVASSPIGNLGFLLILTPIALWAAWRNWNR